MHGGELIAGECRAQGVEHLFTLCGGHISPILTAAKGLGIRVIDVRDEATAVFAADAVARLTGRPGVAAVTAGPGLTNTITAIKNARLAQSPVVVIGGAAPTILKGKGALQDIDQRALVGPHVKSVRCARRVRELVPAVRQAFAKAKQGVPGPVFVECPVDLLYPEPVIRGWYEQAAPAGGGLTARLLRRYLNHHLRRQFAGGGGVSGTADAVTAPRASPSERARVLAALAEAERPLLLIGSQAMLQERPVSELVRSVEALGLPVYLSGMARGLLGKAHPLHLRHQRRLALREADCVMLAGVPCDFRLDYGNHIPGRATLVSVNRSRRDLNLNRRPNIAVKACAGDFLCELAGVAGAGGAAGQNRSDWLVSLRARDEEREGEIDAQAAEASAHVNPLYLLRAIDAALADDSIVVADGGDFVATASYTVRPRRPLSWLDPGAFGTLGVGAGFAAGAKLARPGAETWILYGDGAFGYSLIEFETFVRLEIPVIAVIGNDACWSQIAREQVKLLDDDVGTRLRHTDYHLAAEGLGARGLLLSAPEQVESVLQQAKQAAAAGKPVLINALLGSSSFREGSVSM